MSDRFEIIGSYKDGDNEVLDTCNAIHVADYLVEEYRMSFGNDWDVYIEDNYNG